MHRSVRTPSALVPCLWAVVLVTGIPAGFARAQDLPSEVAAAVGALRRQEFAEALRIVEEARPALAGERGENDPAVLTLRVLGAQAEYGLGRPEGAIALLDPFLRAAAASAPLVSPSSDWNALHVLGDSFMALGRWEEALECLERAWTLVAGEGDPADRAPGRSRGVDRATTLGKIGTAKARLGDWEGAKRAFGAQADALAGEPDGGGPFLAAAHSGLGLVADNTGDHAAAALHYAEAATIYDRAFGPDHPYAKRSRDTLERARARTTPIGSSAVAASPAAPADAPAVRPAGPGGDEAAPRIARGPSVGWPAAAGAAAALLLGWLVWSGFLRRRPGGAEIPDDSGSEA